MSHVVSALPTECLLCPGRLSGVPHPHASTGLHRGELMVDGRLLCIAFWGFSVERNYTPGVLLGS